MSAAAHWQAIQVHLAVLMDMVNESPSSDELDAMANHLEHVARVLRQDAERMRREEGRV